MNARCVLSGQTAITGSFPGVLLYALAEANGTRFQNGALVFGLVLLVATYFWLVVRWLEPSIVKPDSERI